MNQEFDYKDEDAFFEDEEYLPTQQELDEFYKYFNENIFKK
jgi:hypothetical protein